MRRGLAAVAAVAMAMPCVAQPAAEPKLEPNPFFTEWTTPFGMPPFDRIRPEHFVPAFEAGIAERKKEIEAIAANPERSDVREHGRGARERRPRALEGERRLLHPDRRRDERPSSRRSPSRSRRSCRRCATTSS